MTWTKKHIEQLKAEGKIKGFTDTQKAGKNIPHKSQKKSRAIIWLDLNLQYWCKERSLQLEKEYKFSPERKYRSDYAIESLKLLIEYEGGIFMPRGGHNSHQGIQRDIDKYTLAQQLGYTVIRLTAKNYKTVLEQLNQIVK